MELVRAEQELAAGFRPLWPRPAAPPPPPPPPPRVPPELEARIAALAAESAAQQKALTEMRAELARLREESLGHARIHAALTELGDVRTALATLTDLVRDMAGDPGLVARSLQPPIEGEVVGRD